MKAIVYHKYGMPDVLHLEDVDKPVPGDNEVLVKVHAASVNNWDWDLVKGTPYFFRFISGYRKPKFKIIGSDIAGVAETVGKKVTAFKPGDAVFGDVSVCGFGAFAEYVAVPEKAIAKKSAKMSFEQAAAFPQAGVMAYQGIKNYGKVTPGMKVLINGAAGGTGTFAMQLAKHEGAEITAVDSAEKFDFLRSLGADHLIDYKTQDYTKNGMQYDLIIDVIAQRKFSDYKQALKEYGQFYMVGGYPKTMFWVMIRGLMVSITGKKKLGLLIHQPNKHLDLFNEFFESGKIKPIIDKTYPLEQVPDAISYLGEGKVKGKVVIKIA